MTAREAAPERSADEDIAPDDTDLFATDHDEGPRAGPAVRIAGALIPLALGVFGLVNGLRFGVGDPRDPGPGMWPLMMSVALIVGSLVLLAFERDEHDYEKYTRGAVLNLYGVLSLVAYVLIFSNLGFELATAGVTAFWLKVLGGETWRSTILVTLLVTVVAYLLFVTLLGAPIPRQIGV
jgi:putative tricarboxylic transport membrane protein